MLLTFLVPLLFCSADQTFRAGDFGSEPFTSPMHLSLFPLSGESKRTPVSNDVLLKNSTVQFSEERVLLQVTMRGALREKDQQCVVIWFNEKNGTAPMAALIILLSGKINNEPLNELMPMQAMLATTVGQILGKFKVLNKDKQFECEFPRKLLSSQTPDFAQSFWLPAHIKEGQLQGGGFFNQILGYLPSFRDWSDVPTSSLMPSIYNIIQSYREQKKLKD